MGEHIKHTNTTKDVRFNDFRDVHHLKNSGGWPHQDQAWATESMNWQVDCNSRPQSLGSMVFPASNVVLDSFKQYQPLKTIVKENGSVTTPLKPSCGYQTPLLIWHLIYIPSSQ